MVKICKFCALKAKDCWPIHEFKFEFEDKQFNAADALQVFKEEILKVRIEIET